MRLQLDRPLAFLDIESTGANRATDRIIDLAIIRLEPDGRREEALFRVHPGVPIPPEVSKIHGIRDEDVKDAPPFAQVADAIAQMLAGCDLGGYNLLRFDIPMLQEEFRRAQRTFDMTGRRIIDVQRIYHRREPRDLSAALMFYCGQTHAGAHGALADTDATIRVLEGQLERYPDLCRDAAGLAEYSNPAQPGWVDAEGKLAWDKEGEVVLNFGPQKGKRLRDLVKGDKGFLDWMLKKDFSTELKNIIREALLGRYPPRPPTS